MSTRAVEAALAHLAPVELTEIDVAAPMLTRRDRKYVVPIGDAIAFVRLIGPSARVLTMDGRRSFRYESVYFDTPELTSYLAAARRRPRRYKIRTRTYVDTGVRLLEIKLRGASGRTIKVRTDHGGPGDDALDEASLSFLSACPMIDSAGWDLEPVLRTAYLRSTLLVGGDSRVTIDLGVRATASDGRNATLAGTAVIETKTAGLPSASDRLLWQLGHRPIIISKFCTGLAALRPDLPSNRWTRALRHDWVIADRVAPPLAAAG